MKKYFLAALIFLFPVVTPFAALPPLAQTSREIQAILSDSHCQEYLGSAELIQNVVRTKEGYLVMTLNYLMRVDIEYKLAHTRVGPAHFELLFYPPVNLLTGEIKTL